MTFKELPKEIQDWLQSNELNRSLSDLENRYGFHNRPAAISKALFLLASKQITPAAFGSALEKDLGNPEIDRANALINELRDIVLSPLARPLLNIGVDINLLGPIKNMSAISEPSQKEKLKPAFAPGEPFILHEEETRTTGGSSTIKPSLSRPSFYKPGFSQYSENYSEKPQAVRLELGEEKQRSETSPATIRVGQEEARVVHYSEMRTPLDPFTKTAQKPSPAEMPQKKKDVHPDNVINLKDLPL